MVSDPAAVPAGRLYDTVAVPVPSTVPFVAVPISVTPCSTSNMIVPEVTGAALLVTVALS